MYLLGFLKFSHDSELKYISVSRLSVAFLTGTLTVYMIPGLWGAPLKLIAAFPPPLEYSESPYGVGNRLGSSEITHVEGQHLGPQGIMAFNDYELGLAYAKEVRKPIVIDFTGKACVNCREMEQAVWSDPIIKNILKNDVVLISTIFSNPITVTLPSMIKQCSSASYVQSNLLGSHSQIGQDLKSDKFLFLITLIFINNYFLIQKV